MKDKQEFRICSVYDTETTNIGEGTAARAFPVLFICNDLRNCDIAEYSAGASDDIKFFRYADEMHDYIADLISWGVDNSCVPICCAYNLMFDLQPLMLRLSQDYKLTCVAQSSTNVYKLDLFDKTDEECERVLLRFWDTFHLEQRGLSAMGVTCGLAKANGDWDYHLIRSAQTPLTDEELFYAARDVQVIPAYLRWLLEANEWLEPSQLGTSVLTKTSIVRQMARKNIGQLTYKNKHGHRMKLQKAFELTCWQELPRNWFQYGLRKACFRGGFTFTAANYANKVVENVASLDVTSMHHTFINGKRVPVHFRKLRKFELQIMLEAVLSTSFQQVLKSYEQPFRCAFHAKVRFTNLRMKRGSAFERWGIALIPKGKFKHVATREVDYGFNQANIDAEEYLRKNGFHDLAKNPVFAFGKLMSADMCDLYLTEVELWSMSRVYDWDNIEPIYGEGTMRHIAPPDFVTLQSNLLFNTKTDAKNILKYYEEGTPYTRDIPSTIPQGIAAKLKDGTCSRQFFEGYYQATVKGMFNAIYGTQAQDIYKPEFQIVDGEISVNRATILNAETFSNEGREGTRVLYTYGMRIVGYSRMHLILAIELLANKLGSRVVVTGGDTDSVKVSCAKDVTSAELLDALTDLHEAATRSINICMKRVRTVFPGLASPLTHIGCFEVENDNDFYAQHMEAWNKARVSLDTRGRAHITCAGLSRPENAYHIEKFIEDMCASGHDFAEIAPLCIGYNVHVAHEISHALQKTAPSARDRFTEYVTDYLGNTYLCDAPASIALYSCGRWLGETSKTTNEECVKYLQKHGTPVETRERYLELEDGRPVILISDGLDIIKLE